MLPNFFVIGAAKCGTTSLALYLGLHPEIHISPLNEPRYFAQPDVRRPFPGRRVGNRGEYEELFDSPLPLRGEVCGAYSQDPWRPGVPQRIHALIPDARFIYVVGDPIRRVEAHYMQAVAEEDERRSLSAVLGDITRPENPVICPSRYASQIDNYTTTFPPDSLLVIDQSELRDRRSDALSEIFGFLEVDASYWCSGFDSERNQSGAHRRLSSGLYGRLRRSRLRSVVSTVPAALRGRMLEKVRHTLADQVERPSLDTALRVELEEHFRPELERLRDKTGKAFASWSL